MVVVFILQIYADQEVHRNASTGGDVLNTTFGSLLYSSIVILLLLVVPVLLRGAEKVLGWMNSQSGSKSHSSRLRRMWPWND